MRNIIDMLIVSMDHLSGKLVSSISPIILFMSYVAHDLVRLAEVCGVFCLPACVSSVMVTFYSLSM